MRKLSLTGGFVALVDGGLSSSFCICKQVLGTWGYQERDPLTLSLWSVLFTPGTVSKIRGANPCIRCGSLSCYAVTFNAILLGGSWLLAGILPWVRVRTILEDPGSLLDLAMGSLVLGVTWAYKLEWINS